MDKMVRVFRWLTLTERLLAFIFLYLFVLSSEVEGRAGLCEGEVVRSNGSCVLFFFGY